LNGGGFEKVKEVQGKVVPNELIMMDGRRNTRCV
jgi:hypothetical protein